MQFNNSFRWQWTLYGYVKKTHCFNLFVIKFVGICEWTSWKHSMCTVSKKIVVTVMQRPQTTAFILFHLFCFCLSASELKLTTTTCPCYSDWFLFFFSNAIPCSVIVMLKSTFFFFYISCIHLKSSVVNPVSVFSNSQMAFALLFPKKLSVCPFCFLIMIIHCKYLPNNSGLVFSVLCLISMSRRVPLLLQLQYNFLSITVVDASMSGF